MKSSWKFSEKKYKNVECVRVDWCRMNEKIWQIMYEPKKKKVAKNKIELVKKGSLACKKVRMELIK